MIKNFIEKIKNLGEIKEYIADETIIYEGQTGNTIFFLLSGEVKVIIYIETGKELTIAHIKSFNFFGEMAVLGETQRTANVVAATNCKVVEIKKEDFFNFIKQENETFYLLLLEMVKRLRAANRKIYLLTINKASERIKLYLQDLFLETKLKNSKMFIPYHTEIAKELALTRETVSRILSNFKKKGIISNTRGYVTVNYDLLLDQ